MCIPSQNFPSLDRHQCVITILLETSKERIQTEEPWQGACYLLNQGAYLQWSSNNSPFTGARAWQRARVSWREKIRPHKKKSQIIPTVSGGQRRTSFAFTLGDYFYFLRIQTVNSRGWNGLGVRSDGWVIQRVRTCASDKTKSHQTPCS